MMRGFTAVLDALYISAVLAVRVFTCGLTYSVTTSHCSFIAGTHFYINQARLHKMPISHMTIDFVKTDAREEMRSKKTHHTCNHIMLQRYSTYKCSVRHVILFDARTVAAANKT